MHAPSDTNDTVAWGWMHRTTPFAQPAGWHSVTNIHVSIFIHQDCGWSHGTNQIVTKPLLWPNPYNHSCFVTHAHTHTHALHLLLCMGAVVRTIIWQRDRPSMHHEDGFPVDVMSTLPTDNHQHHQSLLWSEWQAGQQSEGQTNQTGRQRGRQTDSPVL